nr:MAG TPA: hypothetical protein [Caudoviricetes sp.]
MVNITKRVHFYLTCRADIDKHIEQEMRAMLVGIYHTEYFDASGRLRKLTGAKPGKFKPCIRVLFDCTCAEDEFNKLVKHFEEDKEIVDITIL